MAEIVKSRIAEIVSLYKDLAKSLKTSLEKALRIGELLTQQKDDMKHGEFMPWVKKNLPFITDRTARRWMNLHKNRDRLKMDSVSDLTTAYKLLESPKEHGDTYGRTIVQISDVEQNPFFDLSKIPPPAIEHWANCLRDERFTEIFDNGVPYWVFGVRKHKDKYQLLCDHDRWAAMKLVGTKEAAVFICHNVTDEQMKWYLKTFDYKWYDEYMKYLKLTNDFEA